MGAQQILDAILHDANADATSALDAAKASAKQTKEDALARAQKQVDEIVKKTNYEKDETEKRRLLTAGIEARKNSLKAKRELIDEVFNKAKVELEKLDAEAYIALMIRLVVNGSQTGDELVLVDESAKERFVKPYSNGKNMIERLNDALKAAGKNGSLKLSPETGSFGGGVKLIGKDTDIDCSFGALVDSFRDLHETEVSELLFKTEE